MTNLNSVSQPTKGVLVINLGTPSAPDTRSVRRYLKQFLSDPAVITIPGWARWLLLRLIILPFRSPKSAKAYQSIWTEEGSPLMVYSKNFIQQLQKEMNDMSVVLAMRYDEPSIESGLKQLAHCEKIVIIPMYPQFANATTQSTIDEVERVAKKIKLTSQMIWIREFYHKREFAQGYADQIRKVLSSEPRAYVLMSYHGLPKSHLPSDCRRKTCFRRDEPCPTVGGVEQCYRLQCYYSSRAIAKELNFTDDDYSISFQSRLGANAWVQPYTDKILVSLHQKGIRHLAVVCPAFVADCIETLEEIAIELKEQWEAMGGESLTLVPCLNADIKWVQSVASWVNEEFEKIEKGNA